MVNYLSLFQNPFFMIESGFHETFSEDLKKKITFCLANLTKMELFITELHYIIMNIQLKDVSPDWGYVSTDLFTHSTLITFTSISLHFLFQLARNF